MKQLWTPKTKKQSERDDRDHHFAKKIKTHRQQKANNAIDRALKRKDMRGIYDMDDFYQ